MAGYEISNLKNGIRVVAAPMKERKSVAVGIWVHVGGRHETEKLSGVSHFLEHIVFKGTKTRTANQIKESIEGVGGSMNAFTSEEYTCFLAKIARKHFENVFEVLSDMVLAASITDTDVQKERTVVMEEIKMTQDQPSQLADELLSEIVWPQHPLGRPLAGTLEFSEVSADVSTGAVTLRARFPNPKGLLLPGMYVRAVISQAVQHGGFVLPEQGLSHDNKGDAFVLLVGADGKVVHRSVQTQGIRGGKWVVTGGLKAGDRVIIQGSAKAKPGQPVNAVAAQGGVAEAAISDAPPASPGSGGQSGGAAGAGR